MSGVSLWLLIGYALANRKNRKAANPERSISIIIAAKDEEENLRHNLPFVLNQTHKNFELIVVLDRCRDGSESIVDNAMKEDSRIRKLVIEKLPTGWTGKKWAIQCGVEAASNELLAFTDADCRPTPKWLESINNAFGEDKELVLGLSPFEKRKGSLNLFVRFETLLTAMRYVAAAGWGAPYMSVGRNLAYRKSFFESVGGMKSFSGRLSGDDDLLVNHFAGGRDVGVMLSNDSMVYTDAPGTVRDWLRQKLRHFSSGSAYKPLTKAFLGGFHLFHAIFYISLLFVLLSSPAWYIFPGIYAIWLLLALLVHYPNARSWKSLDLILFFPILDLMYMLYNTLVGPAGWILKPNWKEVKND